MLRFVKSSAGIRASLPVLLDNGVDGPDDRPADAKEVSSSELVICLLLLCTIFFLSMDVSFFLFKVDLP